MVAKRENKNKCKDGLSLSAQLLRKVDEIEKLAKMDAPGQAETLSNIETFLKDARDSFAAQEFSKGLMAIFTAGQFSGPPGGYSEILAGLKNETKLGNLNESATPRRILKAMAHVIALHHWRNDTDQKIRIGDMANLVIRDLEPARKYVLASWDPDKQGSPNALENAKIPLNKTMKNWLKELPPPSYAQKHGR
jgi:hypothetical protein